MRNTRGTANKQEMLKELFNSKTIRYQPYKPRNCLTFISHNTWLTQGPGGHVSQKHAVELLNPRSLSPNIHEHNTLPFLMTSYDMGQ
jgi:hypothetical protein